VVTPESPNSPAATLKQRLSEVTSASPNWEHVWPGDSKDKNGTVWEVLLVREVVVAVAVELVPDVSVPVDADVVVVMLVPVVADTVVEVALVTVVVRMPTQMNWWLVEPSESAPEPEEKSTCPFVFSTQLWGKSNSDRSAVEAELWPTYATAYEKHSSAVPTSASPTSWQVTPRSSSV
jgi:hypothetical protein